MPKKVIFFLPILATGGAERVTLNFLSQLDRTKYKPYLIIGAMGSKASHLIPSNVEIYDLQSPKTLFSIFKLRNIIKKIQPYAIYSSLNRAHIALYLGLIGMKNKPKTVFRIPTSPKLLFEQKEISRLFSIFLKKALFNATKVIAQTPEMKDEIISFYKIKPNKIDIIINPINKQLIDEKVKEPLDLFNSENINVLAAGRLRYEKGYDTLIKSFKLVHEKNKDFRLYIIGEDVSNELKDYLQLVHKLGLNNIVTFVGFESNPYKYFQQCDLFVLSSRREGLPNAVLENLYLKKPIVTTTCIPFLSELIEDGKNGLLVPVDNSEALANAILSYKEIDTNFSTVDFNDDAVNFLFTFEQ